MTDIAENSEVNHLHNLSSETTGKEHVADISREKSDRPDNQFYLKRQNTCRPKTLVSDNNLVSDSCNSTIRTSYYNI